MFFSQQRKGGEQLECYSDGHVELGVGPFPPSLFQRHFLSPLTSYPNLANQTVIVDNKAKHKMLANILLFPGRAAGPAPRVKKIIPPPYRCLSFRGLMALFESRVGRVFLASATVSMLGSAKTGPRSGRLAKFNFYLIFEGCAITILDGDESSESNNNVDLLHQFHVRREAGFWITQIHKSAL